MVRWLGSAVPAKPPKQKLFGDKPKYLPGFGGTPGGGTPTPPPEPKPPAKKSSAFIWILGGAAVVGGVWWLSGGRMLENPSHTDEWVYKRAPDGYHEWELESWRDFGNTRVHRDAIVWSSGTDESDSANWVVLHDGSTVHQGFGTVRSAKRAALAALWAPRKPKWRVTHHGRAP